MMRRVIFMLCFAACVYASDWTRKVPPSYERRENPFAGQEGAREAGEKLYRRYCASCHGKEAEGEGRTPALRSPRIGKESPGALFWLLRNGELSRGMPSWSQLPEEQRWQIITYLRSLNSQPAGAHETAKQSSNDRRSRE